MKRLGLITDVHADVHALRAALAHLDRIGCDAIVCAGDLVDGGLFPEETIALLSDRAIRCVRGNHDRWATKGGHDMSGWELTGRAIAFLERLPAGWTATLDGVRIVVTHARPGSDMKGIDPDVRADELTSIVTAARADVLIVGHTHFAMHLRLPGGAM